MAKSTLNADGFDTGSNYHFGDKMLSPNFPRSLFDLSHLCSMTIKNAGYVFPISKWRTVPSDEFTISVRSLIRVMPQVVPLYSRQRLYIYAFYSRNGDLWENWNTFARKGLAGTTVKTIPTLNSHNTALSAAIAPDSLADYLDLPIGAPAAAVTSGKLSALPYMMYTRIWRDYFFNHNFAVKSESGSLVNSMQYLLPDNDDHFRLNDDGEIISFKENSVSTLFDLNDTGSLPYLDSNDKFHMGLFPHLYPDDYFTSALPFQQRGDAPVLQYGETTPTISAYANTAMTRIWTSHHHARNSGSYVPADDVTLFNSASGSSASGSVGITPVDTTDGTFLGAAGPGSWADVQYRLNNSFGTWLEYQLNSFEGTGGTGYIGDESGSKRIPVVASISDIGLNVTLNNLRELTISQLELERMARTDGSYNEFAQTFFGVSPKNAIDYKPVYIGGTYTGLSFTEVLQTSASSDSSYLGQYAGHGIGADNDGYLGKIYCDDYGYIMILGCIMPDVYYHQGVSRSETELNQSQMLLPDRAKLGMQPILNQELYFQSYDVVDSDGNPVNENLFAYQDVFDDYRFMNNRIHGKIADSASESFYPFTQSRHFDSLPNWSYEFAAATEVRKDYLAAPSEDAYSAQFAIDVRAVRPLPAQSVPLQFGV